MATFSITDASGAFAIVTQYLKGISDITLNANSPASNEACLLFELDGARLDCRTFYPANRTFYYGLVNLTPGSHSFVLKTYSGYATIPGITPVFYVPNGTLINTYTINITVKDYTKPSITSFSAQRCDSSGVVKGSGTYIKYSLTAAIDPVTVSTNKNTTSMKILYRVQGTGTYSEKVLTTSAFTWNVTGVRITDVVLPASGTYEVLAYIADRWNNASSGTVLPRDVVPLSMRLISNAISVAIGSLADEAGKFKVFLASKFVLAVEFLSTIIVWGAATFKAAPVFDDIPNTLKALGLISATAKSYPRGTMSASTNYMLKWVEAANSDPANLEQFVWSGEYNIIRGWKIKRAGMYRVSFNASWTASAVSVCFIVVVPLANQGSLLDSTGTETNITGLTTKLARTQRASSNGTELTAVFDVDVDDVVLVYARLSTSTTQATTDYFGSFGIERVA